MNPAIGHNGGPNLEGRKESLRTAWAKALFADPKTPVYVMAMAWPIHWYSRADGTGAALSNLQFSKICGISEDTAIKGKRWLRDNGYVQIQVGGGAQRTRFIMTVPDDTTTDADDAHEVAMGGPLPAGGGVDISEGSPESEGSPPAAGGPLPAGGGGDAKDPIFYKNPIPIQEHMARKEKGKGYWKEQFNPDHVDYAFDGATLTLVNGTRTRWLLEFHDDDKALDLALMEVAGRIQQNGNKAISVQVEAGLAKIARDTRNQDRRYEQSKASRGAKQQPESRAARLLRQVEQAAEKGGRS